jgi:hypothetical protein
MKTIKPCSSMAKTLPTLKKNLGFSVLRKKVWPELELNQRHKDFQSSALPTELPGRKILIRIDFVRRFWQLFLKRVVKSGRALS